jgi:hypothetical protein
VSGPRFTIISGDGAIRCVYLTNGACLTGFTLANGATRSTGDRELEQSGGGVWCSSTNAVLTNCVLSGNLAEYGGGAYGGTLYNCALTGNSAEYGGGGASYGTLYNCTLTGNSARNQGGGVDGGTLYNCTLTSNSASWGGGASYGTLYNCTLTGNSASDGGGVDGGTLYNCTLTGNSASSSGGGAYGGTLNNCVVYFNTAPSESNYRYRTELNYCCTMPLPTNGFGNITNSPLFVDYTGGNLRLKSSSPCINAGLNDYAPSGMDLDGNPRIVNGTVDIGAYEYQGPGSVISYAWLQQYGLPTDGSADVADPDGDGLNNWQEWRCLTDPTNPLSALRLLSASSADGHVTVRWQSVAGVNYFLERSTNLSASPPFTPLARNIPGQSGTTTYRDTNAATVPRLFYRVGIGE